MYRLFFLMLMVVMLVSGIVGLQPERVKAQDAVEITAMVQYNHVRIRTHPSTYSSTILDELMTGQRLRVIGRLEYIRYYESSRGGSYSGWVQVEVIDGELSGWVSANYLYFSRRYWVDVVPIVERPVYTPPAPAPPEAVQVTATIIALELNVRVLPHPGADTIGMLYRDDEVIVDAYTTYFGRSSFERSGQWILVHEPTSGMAGWIFSAYARKSPRRSWTRYVPNVNGTDYPATVQAIIETDSLFVRVEPFADAEALGQLVLGTHVTIRGSATIGTSYSVYVYITEDGGDLAGWVDMNYLRTPYACDGTPYVYTAWAFCDVRLRLPIMYTDQPESIAVQGQVVAYVNITSGLRLRSEPNTDARILDDLGVRTLLAVHGRTNHEDYGWVYVTVVETEQSGWVFDPMSAEPQYVFYPEQFQRENLPILEGSASPTVPESPVPVDSLSAMTIRGTPLRTIPVVTGRYHDDYFLRTIPRHTTVSVMGRNVNGRWFYVMYGEYEGWVEAGHLDFEGDPNRLPIVSLLDGTRENEAID